MNADGFEHLEKELAKLRPGVGPRRSILERLAQIPAGTHALPGSFAGRMDQRRRHAWPHASSAKHLTIWQLTTAPTSQPATPQEMAQRQQIILENQKLIASR